MITNSIPKVAPIGAAAKVGVPHPPAGSALLSEADWAATARALRLSGRELQIVRGVFNCHKETAIAADLGIARRTVDTHLERLYRKLAVTTRVALVLRVMEGVLLAKAKLETGGASMVARMLVYGSSVAVGVG